MIYGSRKLTSYNFIKTTFAMCLSLYYSQDTATIINNLLSDTNQDSWEQLERV